ncbi:MAG TPA: sigma-54-dependent Fis family transcriptional regulator [Pseudogracilibacillus sp.]|nr:sigma-54-dependent Fis family transcriptional regulator [Pseudogracilibacillus sp.]
MHEILVIGVNKLAEKIITKIEQVANMQVIAQLTEEQIGHEEFIKESMRNQVDFILETTGDSSVYHRLDTYKHSETIILQKDTIIAVMPFFTSKHIPEKNAQLILDHLPDGIVFVNTVAEVMSMNKRAKEILDIHDPAIGKNIAQLMPESKLQRVLQRQEKEIHQKHELNNGDPVFVSSIPVLNKQKHLVGAVKVFTEAKEVQQLAEENTDLKEVQTILKAIIHSSDEAISVVDEFGQGLMINPAYTKLTTLTEKDVIGKPASTDIYEGESIHLQVLNTRRPVRGAKLTIGPNKKEVLVNVAPIIVRGKLKGSVAVIHDISKYNELSSELDRVKQLVRNLEASYTFDDIIGQSAEMNLSIEQAKIAANTPVTVLLRGASGTGKELFAHAIHQASDRRHRKFIRVNCAAIAESVLESELFGYVEGAFTGAKIGGKKGLFEEANHGSIFLDEIGELSLAIQAKLLRVLQENEVMRVGSTTPITLDVRIITATNANLEKAITKGTFREDLYYRLNRLPIYIPALRDRIDDLPLLVDFLIEKVNRLYGRNVQSISDSALHKLMAYDWPGNVRELENVINRAVIFMETNASSIQLDHLPTLKNENEEIETRPQSKDLSLQEAMDAFEKDFIEDKYKSNQYNKTKTAKELNISVRNLYYKLEKYHIN